MSAKIIAMGRKRSFTSAEQVIERVREAIFADGRPYKDIAKEIGVSKSTINNLASGRTRWPRPTTLFPVMLALGLELDVREKRG